MASLQDQLLKAGIVNDKKAKKLKQEKRKQAKQLPKGTKLEDETKALAAKALAEKAEQDRAREQQRQQAKLEKEILAQVKQIISTNAISKNKGDVPFQFVDNKKIKKIYVTKLLQDQLTKGQLAIAKLDGGYQLIPIKAAAKIQERAAAQIAYLADTAEPVTDEDDPYADYQIPDDLMW